MVDHPSALARPDTRSAAHQRPRTPTTPARLRTPAEFDRTETAPDRLAPGASSGSLLALATEVGRILRPEQKPDPTLDAYVAMVVASAPAMGLDMRLRIEAMLRTTVETAVAA